MFSESKALTPRATLEYPLGHPPERMALAAVGSPDARVIVFSRNGDEPRIQVMRDVGAPMPAVTPLAQEFVLHSPTGLEFGYGGSGPADCALNVLSLVVSPREAWRLHQDFKGEVIAKIPRIGGTVALADVRAWIAKQYAAELADADRMTDEREMRELLAEIELEEQRAAEA